MRETKDSVVCRFYRLIPDAPVPRPADRSADGTLPVNAYRYCEAIASASAFGWYMYPPLSFSLWWDGTEIAWTYGGADEWYALRGAQYPGFIEAFRKAAPADIATLAPPFLSREVSLALSRSGELKVTRILKVSLRRIPGSAHSLQISG